MPPDEDVQRVHVQAGDGKPCMLRPRMSEVSLTAPQVAVFLYAADKTAYTMAQKGEIPAFKVRGQWRFRRADIDSWIHAQTTAAQRKGDGDA